MGIIPEKTVKSQLNTVKINKNLWLNLIRNKHIRKHGPDAGIVFDSLIQWRIFFALLKLSALKSYKPDIHCEISDERYKFNGEPWIFETSVAEFTRLASGGNKNITSAVVLDALNKLAETEFQQVYRNEANGPEIKIKAALIRQPELKNGILEISLRPIFNDNLKNWYFSIPADLIEQLMVTAKKNKNRGRITEHDVLLSLYVLGLNNPQSYYQSGGTHKLSIKDAAIILRMDENLKARQYARIKERIENGALLLKEIGALRGYSISGDILELLLNLEFKNGSFLL